MQFCMIIILHIVVLVVVIFFAILSKLFLLLFNINFLIKQLFIIFIFLHSFAGGRAVCEELTKVASPDSKEAMAVAGLGKKFALFASIAEMREILDRAGLHLEP